MALALKDRVKETTIVVGTGTATLLGSSIGFQPFSVVGNGNTTYYCISDQFGSNWEVGIGTYTTSGNTLARTTVLASSNAGALVVFTAGIKDVFVTYPAEKGVWLDASGNAIGLGTPASGVVTNLTGTASININGTVGATTATTGAFTTLAYTGTLTGSTGVLNIGSGQVYKDASGNVGIGTTAPPAKLTVMAAGESTVLPATYVGDIQLNHSAITTLQQVGGLEFKASPFGTAGYGAKITCLDAGELLFGNRIDSATWTERMRIDASGNVLVGATSNLASSRLDVRGRIRIGSGNSSGDTELVFSNYASATTAWNVSVRQDVGGANNDLKFLRFDSAGNYQGIAMQITSAGGIVSMPAYGAGAATFSAAGVISSVSDETWKIKDGVPNNPDEMLQKLKPGYWFYNEEKAPIFGTDRQLGFYAQNVNEAIGIEAAPTPEEGKPWGYYDRSVLAVAVMSLQKALATIEALTARLTALEAK